jgi:glucose-6-phosphate-specific signal transduction histidine kinase
MTATNHALTGAVVAMAIHQPLLAIPLACLSHFVLDAIPHFGIHEDDHAKRNSHWLFRTVISIDTVLAASMLVTIPLLAHGNVSWWIILLGMLAGIAPDAVWIYRFVRYMRNKIIHPYGRIAQFHQNIQWSEKPWGLVVEIVWMIVALIAISSLAS